MLKLSIHTIHISYSLYKNDSIHVIIVFQTIFLSFFNSGCKDNTNNDFNAFFLKKIHFSILVQIISVMLDIYCIFVPYFSLR